MIDKLIAILQDTESGRMNKSNVIGFLGELYVKQNLEDHGFIVNHMGNQSNVDLFIGSSIAIDVKTATLKEPNSAYPNWGFALLSKENAKATHYICVALDNDYSVDSYFVINKTSLIYCPPPESKRFKKLKYTFLTKKYADTLLDLEPYNICQRMVDSGEIIKVASYQNLGLYL